MTVKRRGRITGCVGGYPKRTNSIKFLLRTLHPLPKETAWDLPIFSTVERLHRNSRGRSIIDFCPFQSEFFKTRSACSQKFNQDFSHENQHSGTGYIETAVFVPYADFSHDFLHSGTALFSPSSIVDCHFLCRTMCRPSDVPIL